MLAFAVDWADLPIIDISKASTPEGRTELATEVRDAMRTFGFMYIVNHGLTLWDVASTRFQGDREQWEPIITWVN